MHELRRPLEVAARSLNNRRFPLAHLSICAAERRAWIAMVRRRVAMPPSHDPRVMPTAMRSHEPRCDRAIDLRCLVLLTRGALPMARQAMKQMGMSPLAMMTMAMVFWVACPGWVPRSSWHGRLAILAGPGTLALVRWIRVIPHLADLRCAAAIPRVFRDHGNARADGRICSEIGGSDGDGDLGDLC